MTTLKEKVTAKLIKRGNNINDVNDMVNLHFDTYSKTNKNVSSIATAIRINY